VRVSHTLFTRVPGERLELVAEMSDLDVQPGTYPPPHIIVDGRVGPVSFKFHHPELTTDGEDVTGFRYEADSPGVAPLSPSSSSMTRSQAMTKPFDIRCGHINGEGGICTAGARWDVYIGNGDTPDHACGRHLGQVVSRVYEERGKRVLGGEITVRRIHWAQDR
jgi:hypothetical protein